MSGHIRRADIDDIPRLIQLEHELFPNNSMGETMLAREIAAGEGWVFTDNALRRVLGYALLRWDEDITRLGVDPFAQGSGIGKRLLEHVLSLGHPTMLTVRKNNWRAVRLYLRAGFAIAGELTSVHAWVLRRAAQP